MIASFLDEGIISFLITKLFKYVILLYSMKTLKFAEPLPSLILNKEKNTTWRIEDEKYLSVNDVVSCLRKKDLSEFAKIKFISVKETTFEYLSFEDKDGHETFSSDDEMYETYSKYYSMEVKPETELKVVKFELL